MYDLIEDLFGDKQQSKPRILSILEPERYVEEPDYPLFDFDIFSELVEDVYFEFDDHPYTLQEVLSVFRHFFDRFYEYIGNHPPVRKEHIRIFVEVMPWPSEYLGGCDVIDPEEYPAIIDEYFESDFKDCNYRIHHFFSGKIRLITRKKVERAKKYEISKRV